MHLYTPLHARLHPEDAKEHLIITWSGAAGLSPKMIQAHFLHLVGVTVAHSQTWAAQSTATLKVFGYLVRGCRASEPVALRLCIVN